MSLEQLRDIVVIVYGVVGILLFLILDFATVGLLFTARALTRAVRALLEDPVRPTIDEFRATMHNVRGTTEFMADTTVHPLIRIISIGRGIKRGLSVAAGLRRPRE